MKTMMNRDMMTKEDDMRNHRGGQAGDAPPPCPAALPCGGMNDTIQQKQGEMSSGVVDLSLK